METRKGVAVSYSRNALPYNILSKNNVECPLKTLKSYKDTSHGPLTDFKSELFMSSKVTRSEPSL